LLYSASCSCGESLNPSMRIRSIPTSTAIRSGAGFSGASQSLNTDQVNSHILSCPSRRDNDWRSQSLNTDQVNSHRFFDDARDRALVESQSLNTDQVNSHKKVEGSLAEYVRNMKKSQSLNTDQVNSHAVDVDMEPLKNRCLNPSIRIRSIPTVN